MDRAFDGSLPSFITAFLKTKTLTSEEAAEIQEMINSAAQPGHFAAAEPIDQATGEG